MLIETITFEVRNFTTHEFENFVIEDNDTNYTMVMQHRFTRNIKFVKKFDFQFEKERKAPKFIEFATAVADSLFSADPAIDEIDEMVGTF
jgi:hypothetical protein